MKRGLVIGVIILVIILGVYFYISQGDTIKGGMVPFELGEENIVAKIPLDENSAKILAEKAIDTTKYSIVGETSKEDEKWIVLFECNEEATYVCGGRVLIDEVNRKISVQHYL